MLPTLQILREFARPATVDKPVKEKLEQFLVFEDKVQDRFGWKFVMGMEDAWDDLHAAELDHAYEQGFLTAWKLWMEVSATDCLRERM